ncbi:hypothetical protein EB796_011931 [Bugula neritina]|uniref:Uncharacterized protein n=1 Tax=Bugula neritina TaxID=10212 RepID=A0A7J7JVK8_BUGNE|nr:hypothetical protein EB796_011931 [Bugula neritina]
MEYFYCKLHEQKNISFIVALLFIWRFSINKGMECMHVTCLMLHHECTAYLLNKELVGVTESTNHKSDNRPQCHQLVWNKLEKITCNENCNHNAPSISTAEYVPNTCVVNISGVYSQQCFFQLYSLLK